MSKIRRLSRRDFLKTGGVLVLGVSMAGCGRDTTPIPTRPVSVEPWSPDVYISFDADGTVNIISHRSEMGQGIRTGLPAVVADEMEADWKRVRVVQAPGDAIYGNQNTDGSWSVRGFMQRMREAGATARLMLEQAAAQEWGVDVAECQAQLHKVIHQSSGKSLGFADLVAIASTLPVPGLEVLTLKSPEQFRYIGKPLPIVDLDDMATVIENTTTSSSDGSGSFPVYLYGDKQMKKFDDLYMILVRHDLEASDPNIYISVELIDMDDRSSVYEMAKYMRVSGSAESGPFSIKIKDINTLQVVRKGY